MKVISCALLFVALVCACGGGGTAAPPAAAMVPVAAPASAPPAALVAGLVVQSPADAYGPAPIDGISYASADAAQTAPLANATVIVGPVPVAGATPPAHLPGGDVAVTTNAAGAFAANVPAASAAPSTSEPFVIPPNDILGFTPPANGYYIEVFAAGSNGTSAGIPIPLHRFVAPSSALTLRVSTPSAAEAAALAAVNGDRAANGAGPLTFDESAEEVARLHASDESARGYTCHYDTRNVGPSSRYLAAGGLGLTGEGLDFSYGPDSVTAFANNERAFMLEQTQQPPGEHFLNLVDASHAWAGVAAAASVASPGFYNIDYDLVTPGADSSVVGASGYPATGACPAGVLDNNS